MGTHLPAGVTPLLTQEQAAAYLQISPTTLKTYRTRGGGPVATLAGRAVRYRLEDLDAWTTRESRTPVPAAALAAKAEVRRLRSVNR